MASESKALGSVANRLARSQGSRPSVLTGAGRAGMETKTAAMALPYLSLMAARALNQFMKAEVSSESVR